MKICFVVSQIFAYGKYGGFGSLARTIGKELVKKGIDVSVVVPLRKNQKPIEKLDGMTIYGFKPSHCLFVKKLYKLTNSDIYHSQEPSFGTYLAMKSMPSRKHIITCQDPRDKHDWEIFHKYWTSSKKITFPLSYIYEHNYFNNQSVRIADAVFCQAKFVIPKAKKIYKLSKDPEFLPNPISIPERQLSKSVNPTVSFVGRLDIIKRPELFCLLAKQFPNVKFLLLGKSHDEKYDNYLKEKFGRIPNLEMVGFVDKFSSYEKFSNILEKSWILINTSVRECLPMCFLEAAAHKCAILSGTEQDPDDFAKSFGCYVKNDDYAKGLEFLLENNRWKNLGETGYEYVKKTHELNSVIDNHISIYEKLLS